MNIQKQFVSYEIALKLKELGFDEACLTYYDSGQFQRLTWNFENDDYNKYSGRSKKWVSAPLYQQVVDWLREVHEIFIKIDVQDIEEKVYMYDILKVNVGKYNNDLVVNTNFKIYYEAFNLAIFEALKLI